MPPADDKRGKLPPLPPLAPPPPRNLPSAGGAPPTTGPIHPGHLPPRPGMKPIPTPEGFMSTAAKISLADMALALREEQIEAKVVEYKGELATNPELDAVTA